MLTPDEKAEEYREWLKNREEECVPNDADCEWCPVVKDCKRVKK